MPLGDFLSDVCDGIPIVGHVKGVIHDIAGDEEAARRSYAAANRSTVVAAAAVAGTMAGGPLGGAAAATSAGALTDVAVSVATDKPVGIVDDVARIAQAQNLGEVIRGVGQMTVSVVADAATGASAGVATKAIVRQAGKEAGKQAARRTAVYATGEVVKHTTRTAAIAAVAHSSSDTADLSDVSSLESTSSEEEEDGGFIYLFTCPDGTYKVGRTGRASALPRLNEHRRHGLIKPHTSITAYECPSHVTKAEALILGEIQILNARIIKRRRTEILDSSQVELQHVDGVIRRVIAELNNIPPLAVRTWRYRYDSKKITPVS